MTSITTSSEWFQVHGNGEAYSGSYPDIGMKFDITFTRESGQQKVTWATSNTDDWLPDYGRYGFKLFVYVAVNPVDPDDPDDDELWTIFKKDNYTEYNWWNTVEIYNRGYPTDTGCYINTTASTANVYIYASSDCTSDGHYCYGSPEYNYYCIHSFTANVPTYETKYTVTYDVNGGQGTVASQTKSSLSDLTLSTTVPTFPLTLKYYNNSDGSLSNTETIYREFLGWKCSADGQIYQAGGTYALNSDCTMTAQWGSATFTSLAIPNKYYTVTYNYNGGTGSPSDVTCARNEVGYATSSGSTVKVYDQETTYSSGITTDLNLYPIYGNATLSSLPNPAPTRKGYMFLGWFAESTFVTEVTTPYTVTGDITLYAKWLALPIHVMQSDGTWDEVGPYVWRFNGTAWEKVAHIYMFDGTSWKDLSV